MASINFDANKVEPNAGFDPIPEGQYVAIISESAMKPTKNGDGQYLELTFQVLEGPHKGRNLWTRLNLWNPNPKAVQIAQGELSAICRAVGVMTPQDSAELHNLPMLIGVKLRKRPDTGDMTNEIRSFAKKDAVVALATAGAGNGGTQPPWARKA